MPTGPKLEIRTKMADKNPTDSALLQDEAKSHSNIGVEMSLVGQPQEQLDA